MKRRAFIAGLGSAVTSSFALDVHSTIAQVGKKRALLGYLAGATQADAAEFTKIFLDGLREQGYIESRDFNVAYRFAAARLPDLYSFRDGVIAGGLLSYGVNIRLNFRKGAALVVKILQGTSPAQIPVEFPLKLELVINLKTAKSLGLTFPVSVLARADEVIE